MGGTAELLSGLGQTPAAALITLVVASLIRAWRTPGPARVYAASAALAFAGLLVQLYFAPLGLVPVALILIAGLAAWTASLIMTRGWYLLLEVFGLPVINIALLLITP